MKRQLIAFLAILSIALLSEARPPQRGYRGFAEWSNSLRSDDIWGLADRTTSFYTGCAMSHGYQFNPWLFAGAGIDIEHCSKINSTIGALFAEGRTDLKFGKFTPFGDLRLGYNLSHGGGVYFSPSIGYRYNWGRKVGINLAAGLTLSGYTVDILDVNQTGSGYCTYSKVGEHHGTTAFFSFRLGIDF